jgi:hypothetical protein
MKLADIITEIERRYTCRQGLLGAKCNTDEPYVVIGTPKHGRRLPAALPGVVPEGEPQEVWTSEDEACTRFMEAFNRYAEACRMFRGQGDGPDVLYWRYAAPHIYLEFGTRTGKGWTLDRPKYPRKFRVRARLCISPKPVVWNHQRAYDAYLTAQEEISDGEISTDS